MYARLRARPVTAVAALVSLAGVVGADAVRGPLLELPSVGGALLGLVPVLLVAALSAWAGAAIQDHLGRRVAAALPARLPGLAGRLPALGPALGAGVGVLVGHAVVGAATGGLGAALLPARADDPRAPWLDWVWTVLAVTQGIVLLLLWARAADHLRPRVGALGAALTLGGAAGLLLVVDLALNDDVRHATAGPPVDLAWLEAAERRLDALPADGHPVLLVTASGGGSRAALWAASTYALLDLPAPDLARVAGAPVPAGGCRPLDHLLLVSSVSGGSVASADRLARGWRGEPAPAPPGDEGLSTWLAARPGVRAAGANFDAPALRGLFLPGRSRAAELAASWERSMGWSAAWTARGPAPPLLLLNATVGPSGRRLVFGWPAVPPALLDPAAEDPARRRAVRTRSGAPGYTPDTLGVADAVRMSATFPWGMNPLRVDGLDDLPDHAAGDPTWPIVDGGVLDNTGTDSVAALAAGLRRLSTEPGARGAAAARVLDRLGARGFVLVEIDSGAKPGRLGRARGLLGNLWVPAEAMRWALWRDERARVQAAVGELDRVVGPGEWVPVSYVPDGSRIGTTWALGRDERRRLDAQFVGLATGASGGPSPFGRLAGRYATP